MRYSYPGLQTLGNAVSEDKTNDFAALCKEMIDYTRLASYTKMNIYDQTDFETCAMSQIWTDET